VPGRSDSSVRRVRQDRRDDRVAGFPASALAMARPSPCDRHSRSATTRFRAAVVHERRRLADSLMARFTRATSSFPSSTRSSCSPAPRQSREPGGPPRPRPPHDRHGAGGEGAVTGGGDHRRRPGRALRPPYRDKKECCKSTTTHRGDLLLVVQLKKVAVSRISAARVSGSPRRCCRYGIGFFVAVRSSHTCRNQANHRAHWSRSLAYAPPSGPHTDTRRARILPDPWSAANIRCEEMIDVPVFWSSQLLVHQQRRHDLSARKNGDMSR